MLAGLIQAGCAQNPMALQSQITSLQHQQTALAQRNQELQSRASSLDQDNQDLHTQLAQSERQSRLLQDQSIAMREQLASTTAQLAQSQQDKQLVERNAQAIVASTKRRAGVTISPNSSLAQNLPALTLPGVFVRQDGDVVRIEVSGDQLFEPGGAQLRPEAATLLDAVAGRNRTDLPRANHRHRRTYRQRSAPSSLGFGTSVHDGPGDVDLRLSFHANAAKAEPIVFGRPWGESSGREQCHAGRQSCAIAASSWSYIPTDSASSIRQSSGIRKNSDVPRSSHNPNSRELGYARQSPIPCRPDPDWRSLRRSQGSFCGFSRQKASAPKRSISSVGV